MGSTLSRIISNIEQHTTELRIPISLISVQGDGQCCHIILYIGPRSSIWEINQSMICIHTATHTDIDLDDDHDLGHDLHSDFDLDLGDELDPHFDLDFHLDLGNDLEIGPWKINFADKELMIKTLFLWAFLVRIPVTLKPTTI